MKTNIYTKWHYIKHKSKTTCTKFELFNESPHSCLKTLWYIILLIKALIKGLMLTVTKLSQNKLFFCFKQHLCSTFSSLSLPHSPVEIFAKLLATSLSFRQIHPPPRVCRNIRTDSDRSEWVSITLQRTEGDPTRKLS